MTIGEALKQERNKLSLTQSAMAADIISPSFYSKVENNLHEINVNDLLAILNVHSIDISAFFRKISTNPQIDYFDFTLFTNKILNIWHQQNIEEVSSLRKELDLSLIHI